MSQLPYLGALGPLGSLAAPPTPRVQQPNPLEPLNPQEEQSLLGRIGHGALGGLAWLGGSLSKALGGRAIRGLLGGKPEELLSIIPFSDTLGITDPSQEVHGAELLGEKDAPFLSPAGLGGFGLEVLTDPASYLVGPGAALTRAGKVAKNIGVLPETIGQRASTTLGQAIGTADQALQAAPTAGRALEAGAQGAPYMRDFLGKAKVAARAAGTPLEDLMGQTLGGAFGFRVPFTEPTAVFGGQGFMDALGGIKSGLGSIPGVSQVGNALSEALSPLGRGLRAMFKPEYLGMTGEAGQKAAPGVYKGTQEATSVLKGRIGEIVLEADKGKLLGVDTGQQIRAMLEGKIPVTAEAQPIIDKIVKVKDDLHADLLHLGVAPNELDDEFVKHFPRYMRYGEASYGGAGSGAKPFQRPSPALGQREEIFKNIPEGTGLRRVVDEEGNLVQAGTGIEGMRTDPRIIGDGVTPASAADVIRRDYLNWSPADTQQLNTLRNLPARDAVQQAALDALEGKWSKADKLADMFQNTVPREGMLGFTRHPLDDLLTHGAAVVNKREGLGGVYKIIEHSAMPAAEAGEGAVPILKLLDDVGLTTNNRLDRLAEIFGGDMGAYATKMIPADAYSDAVRYIQGFTRPEAVGPVLNVIDYMTKLFKGMVTSIWPSYHMRNLASNTWMNAVEGALSLKSHQMAHAMLSGETIQGASNLSIFKGLGMSDEAATDAIRTMAYQYRVAGEHTALSASELLDTTSEMLGKMPGKVPNTAESMGQALLGKGPGEAPPTWWESAGNPLNPNTFGPNVAGRKLGTRIEETSRLAGFIELMDQGVAPEMAGARIRAAQVDYGNLSQFEKTVMRRLIPFYTYSRIAIPYQIEQLMARPGGMLGTAIKAAGEARGAEPGFLPSFMQNTVALPIGSPAEEGTQRYLTQLGLPFEDLSQNLSARGILGGLNPYLKAPLELATNQQFFSGRKLSDLYSPTGNVITDQLIYNSPVARLASTASNVADPRKGIADMLLHTLSGVRLSDVDLNKAKNVAIRDFLDQQLSGPNFRRFQSIYVRPEDAANLSPPEAELYRLYVARERAAQQLARQQR